MFFQTSVTYSSIRNEEKEKAEDMYEYLLQKDVQFKGYANCVKAADSKHDDSGQDVKYGVYLSNSKIIN